MNSFDTGLELKRHFPIDFMPGSCNKEILLLIAEHSVTLKKTAYLLHMFAEDGQLQKTVEFRSIEGDNTYSSLSYNQVTKNMIGHVWDYHNDEILIENLCGQTAELQHSYLLYNTNFPKKTFNFSKMPFMNGTQQVVCHPRGTLALVNNFCLILLKNPSQ